MNFQNDFSLTVVHNFRVLVGFKESGVVPEILARAVPAATAWIELFFDVFPKKRCFDIFLLPRCRGWCRVPWGPPGVPLGSSWGAPGVVLGSSWGAPWGAPWDPLGFLGVPRVTLGSLGVTLGFPWLQILIQIRYRY